MKLQLDDVASVYGERVRGVSGAVVGAGGGGGGVRWCGVGSWLLVVVGVAAGGAGGAVVGPDDPGRDDWVIGRLRAGGPGARVARDGWGGGWWWRRWWWVAVRNGDNNSLIYVCCRT